MDFSNYKFRCSALGKIMSTKGDLTVTNKTALLEIFIEETENVKRSVTSKYFEKGIFCEEDGFDLLNKTIHPKTLILKNKQRLNNDYIHGEYDTIVSGYVYDIKNAYDRITFGKASLTDAYEWQGRGYMWLTGMQKFRLFYCLNNMPEHMLLDEERSLFYKNKFVSIEDSNYLKLCEELRAFHNYDEKPLWDRFKVWEIQHYDLKVEELKTKIDKCRSYLNQLNDEREARVIYNKELMGLTKEVNQLV